MKQPKGPRISNDGKTKQRKEAAAAAHAARKLKKQEADALLSPMLSYAELAPTAIGDFGESPSFSFASRNGRGNSCAILHDAAGTIVEGSVVRFTSSISYISYLGVVRKVVRLKNIVGENPHIVAHFDYTVTCPALDDCSKELKKNLCSNAFGTYDPAVRNAHLAKLDNMIKALESDGYSSSYVEDTDDYQPDMISLDDLQSEEEACEEGDY